MRKNLIRAGAFLVIAAAGVAPASGQRIRFAQSAAAPEASAEETPAPEEAEAGPTQPPPKPQSRPPRETLPSPDPRPAAPPPIVYTEPGYISPPLAQRFLPGEIVETPPPFILDSEPAFPIPDGYPYPPSCGPGCYSLFPQMGGGLGLSMFSPRRLTKGLSFGKRIGVFGEFLYLRPRDTEVAIAVPGQAPVVMAGNPTIAVPQGRTVLLDPDYSPGFRAGFDVRIDDCTSLQFAYSQWDGDAAAQRSLSAAEIVQNIVLFPLLIHPRTALPGNVTNVSTDGRLDMDFEIIDADARAILWNGHALTLTGYVGARYAELNQNLQAVYSINTGTVVEAATEYEGAGARLGLDGRGSLGCWGLGIYGRSELSLLYGYSRAEFAQYPLNTPEIPQVFTDWKAGRINPVYEFEMGLQWVGPRERLRLSVGYLASIWFNMVTVEDYLQSIQQNQFDDQGDTITFDGLTARVEFRL